MCVCVYFHLYIYIYIYIYMCVCVCVCVLFIYILIYLRYYKSTVTVRESCISFWIDGFLLNELELIDNIT